MTTDLRAEGPADAATRGPGFLERLRPVLDRLGSLRITIVLFSLAIFLVFAGTMAQTQMDVWEAVNAYFRCWVARIELQVFFPPSFFPSHPQVPGWFPFPGGWLLGSLLFVNLLAASVVRFPIRARGKRLGIGAAVTLLGALAIWVVVASGASKEGLHYSSWFDWSAVWRLFLAALAVGWLVSVGATLRALVRHGTRPRAMFWLLVAALAGQALLGGLLGWLALEGEAVRLNDSNMRILWQLMTATFAALILQAGCSTLFGRKGALVVIHVGIVLMMLGEVLVAVLATEASMTVHEGETVNFVEHTRKTELAVVDSSDPQIDEVVVVPQSMLRRGATISHPDLPCDFELLEYFPNSKLRDLARDDDRTNPATAGVGREQRIVAVPARRNRGTESRLDFPSAYVRVSEPKGGRPIGAYLLSRYLREPQPVAIDGKTYEISLRAKRTYKPYSIRLIDVRKDDYVGTNTPRNYSSEIHLKDPTRGVDRKLKIWMNNPLRFAGETFYQSNYLRDPRTGVEMTGLSVVSNASWMLPYVGCMVVVVGLLVQFWTTLAGYVGRSLEAPAETAGVDASARAEATPKPASRRPAWRSLAGWAIPGATVAAAALFFLNTARKPSVPEGEMDLPAFGRLPAAYQGRVKPLDTLARNTLRIVSDRETFEEDGGDEQPAIRWLADLVADPETGFDHRVFRIRHPQLLYALGLERRPGHRYALAEFQPELSEVAEQAARARAKDEEDLDRYDKKLLELERKLGLVELIVQAFSAPEVREDHVSEDLMSALRRQRALLERQPPLVVPASETQSEEDELAAMGGPWQTLGMAWTLDVVRQLSDREGNPAVELVTRVLAAYADGDAREFNRAVAEYGRYLEEHPPAQYDHARVGFESRFNRAQWFFGAWVWYIVAFLITCLSFLLGFWRRPIARTAFWLLVLLLLVHTLALAGRVAISGRPPVTNLYSTALFVGWAGVLFGLVLQAIYRLGIGNLVAAVAGVSTLQIAWQLAGDGDTFKVMQAVLDTNFWLTTHVLTIALGYTATFVVGFLGMLVVAVGLFTPVLDRRLGGVLEKMIYGVLCFALFFSFIGTVLGGLWADDSWGRFWGWDPKENGALIIVLWNALVLHAYWDRLVKERGLAVLAIGGNICTAWSWFGVNELGVGLHSYGFTEGVLLKLGLFVAVQLLWIGMGLLPLSLWWSHRRRADTPGSRNSGEAMTDRAGASVVA